MHRLLRDLLVRVQVSSTSLVIPRRAGRSAGPFGPHPTAPILARLPLLAADTDTESTALLREGIFLATRHLGGYPEPGARSRLSLRAYELRARWRPVPHGEFAGVALATLADEPARLRVGTRHRARSNPSPAWLAATCAQLVDDATVLRQLTLTTETTAMRRGDRWEAEGEPPEGTGAVERSTVRATAATDLIMAACADGATVDAVLGAVRSRWPDVSDQTVLGSIRLLIRHGFLHTDLLTGDISTDPVNRLLGLLPSAHPAREALSGLRERLLAADTHAPGDPARLSALIAARDLADRICRVERPLTVDVALDADLAIPAHLTHEIARAAAILSRIAPAHDPASGFSRRFAERYGHHRYVPLLEAADPVTGIGTESRSESRTEHDEQRTAALTSLIAKAAAERTIEVDLDDAVIAALATPETTPPRGIDVHARLVAEDVHAAARGAVTAVVTGCVPTAGATVARFASLLGHHHTEPDDGHAVIAELAVRSRAACAQSVAPSTGFAAYRIPVGLPHAGERDLALTDLLLASDGAKVTVYSSSLCRPVIPVFYSRLSPHLLPPIARLLHALGQGGTTPFYGWSWGAAAGCAFQPRVRYQGTVISLARWTLPLTLIDAAADHDLWESELDRWRTISPTPPSTVVTDTDDRQLPLNLEHADDRQLLRRYVRRGLTAVTEPPGGSNSTSAVSTGPHGRHVTELVIPLIRHTAPTRPHTAVSVAARPRGAGRFHPGGPWLSLTLPTAPHLQDDLLQHLAELADRHPGAWDAWFWLRYHTPEHGHHLRARFHGRPETLGARLLPALAAWAAQMTDRHLSGRMSIECYEQEIERYGGPDAIEAAEAVFAADSRLALHRLTLDTGDRLVAAACTAATIAREIADADPAALDGHHLKREARRQMNHLRPRARARDAAGTDPGSDDAALVKALRDHLAAYRSILPAAARTSCASSLIHMHANRTLPSTEDEPVIRALASDLLARAR